MDECGWTRHFDFIPQYPEASSILRVTFAYAERP